MPRRYRKALVLTLGVFIVAGLTAPLTCTAAGPLPKDTVVDRELVLKLLRRDLTDGKNLVGRGTLGHWEIVIPQRGWNCFYPVHYTGEKIVHLGDSVVPILNDIMLDRQQAREICGAAGRWLSFFDDPRSPAAVLDAARSETLNDNDLFIVTDLVLDPQWESESSNPLDALSRPFQIRVLEKAAAQPYDQYRLSVLDKVMKAKGCAEGGFEYDIWDRRVLRWLDRLYDVDLSVWLAEKAPAALDFRNAELRKGYDPVIAFQGFSGQLHTGAIDEGIKSVLADAQERVACRQLIEAVYDPTSPLYPPKKAGWPDRLRAWYWANRKNLIYDQAKHRFVVKSLGTSQSRPASRANE